MRPSSRTAHLSIDRQTVNGVESLAHRFVEGGVSVDGASSRFDSGLRFHRGDRFGDQLECPRAR